MVLRNSFIDLQFIEYFINLSISLQGCVKYYLEQLVAAYNMYFNSNSHLIQIILST